jgi:hypothetical protein
MTHAQCADLAELYALGALDETERAAVDEHLRGCSSCAAIVGAAEHDVALIASMETQRIAPAELAGRVERTIAPPRTAWRFPMAIAAALMLGLLPSVYFWSANRAMHGDMLTQSSTIERLASAPHRMTRFRTAPGMPPAEVIYALDGSWYLVLVHGISKPISVAWMHDGEHTMLGDAMPRGTMASLYLPKSHRMDHLALMDGDRIVATATLSWERTSLNRRGVRSA